MTSKIDCLCKSLRLQLYSNTVQSIGIAIFGSTGHIDLHCRLLSASMVDYCIGCVNVDDDMVPNSALVILMI
jgi:hypothetical protein